ncbi:replication protein A 70 kDa DNA-binding subunit B-like [Bidens hawaiensis]|uniref:replication protein A 70 kDa DNA-binding subunit B-like n=1 Tax=Bidens hawaiensis TaxID=980011 RepID=UPI004049BFE0
MLNETDVLKTSPSTLKENRIQATVYKQDIFRFKIFLKEISTLTIVNPSVDIIGHVVHVFKSNASNVKDKNRRTMEISDLRENCVYLTLWDHYASELSKYVIEHFDEGQAIIVLQFEKVYVSNSFGSNVSRFFINDFLFEIEEYKNSLVDLLNGNDVSVRKPIPVKMLSLIDDEFFRATDFFNIGDICTIIFPKSIIILGTIKAICPDTEWYYIGCNTCSRKLIENNGEGGKEYECKTVRCNVLSLIPTPRFKIKIRVQDSTGVVSLTLFDRDAKMLTKKTAKELIDSQNENKIENGGFPTELDCLLEKIFAFKVDIADFNFINNVEDYGINKLTDDTNIITELQKRLNGCLQSDSNYVTLGASIYEFRSSGSVSIKDVATDTKGMSTSSDDKLKRKLTEVFKVEDDASMSATKMKSKTTEEMGTTSESCEGATLLTPKVEK